MNIIWRDFADVCWVQNFRQGSRRYGAPTEGVMPRGPKPLSTPLWFSRISSTYVRLWLGLGESFSGRGCGTARVFQKGAIFRIARNLRARNSNNCYNLDSWFLFNRINYLRACQCGPVRWLWIETLIDRRPIASNDARCVLTRLGQKNAEVVCTLVSDSITVSIIANF